ncbi:MAG: aspartate aminotransferase family protein [Woeseiaceae bacterium]|nr:aspartate aminotransferase family protein [Woeseiaceae bacterium]|tara:strand:+ start:1667 stop:3100 length:1434 start_codon:yes stop_codon:yes gene_type:complete
MIKTYSLDEIDEMSVNDVHDLYKSYVNQGQVNLLSSFSPARLLVDYSEGQYIYLKNGTIVSDFTAGIGVLNHGHNHPRVLKVRTEFQEKKRMEVHKNFLSPYLAALAHSVSSIMPEDLCMSYFCNSGAEAVEGAVKLAYKAFDGKRKRIAAADISFHGKLLGTAGLTGSKEVYFQWPTIPNIDRFVYNDFESIKNIIQEALVDGESDHYAILIEPMNASNVTECSERFLIQLRELCDKHKIALIFDEVYTGWAKTGAWFYFMHHSVVPDIVSMSKSFGAGKSSISGFVATKHMFNLAYGKDIDSILHSTTYNGFGEECATALESIKVIHEEKLVTRAQEIEDYLLPELESLRDKNPNWISDVRGRGALLGLVLDSDINPILDRLVDLVPVGVLADEGFRKKLVVSSLIHYLYEEHSILTYFGSNVDVPLIIAPTLKASSDDCIKLIRSLEDAFSRNKLSLIYEFARFKFGNEYLNDK